MRRFRAIGLSAGIILGFGAPLGAIFFKWLLFGVPNFEWFIREIAEHRYYYLYMLMITPVVFALFGSYLGGLSDLSRLQKDSLQNQKDILEAQSMTDEVTGLYNHRHLMEEIEKEIERSKRHNHALSALMIDMDNFKTVNELYGHRTGDHVLREVAAVINQSIRKIDILGRYGGDEFIVILPEAKLDAAKVVAQRVLQNMRTHRFQTKRDYISSTVSIGVFFYKDLQNLDVNSFIEQIDDVMFKAKSLGKDRMFVLE